MNLPRASQLKSGSSGASTLSVKLLARGSRARLMATSISFVASSPSTLPFQDNGVLTQVARSLTGSKLGSRARRRLLPDACF
eukprot:827088-Pyramimonas_sp.AAC.2